MFSKKTTKIDKIFTIYLTLKSKREINGEDFINFCGLLRKHELYLIKSKVLLMLCNSLGCYSLSVSNTYCIALKGLVKGT